MSKEAITFENHRCRIVAGAYASIEKILAMEENYYGPVEVLERTATTCTYRFKTHKAYEAKRQGKYPTP